MTMYPVTLHPSFPRERVGNGYSAPIPCPACGHTFKAEWIEVKVDEQTCPACDHRFPAMWPGFEFAPVDADYNPVPPFICQHCGHQYHGPYRSPVWLDRPLPAGSLGTDKQAAPAALPTP